MPTAFQNSVYELTKKISRGKVSTYKEISKKLKSGSRAVGNALNKNPYSFKSGGNVACHRVIKSSGEVGGFASGTENKIKLLKKEGIEVINGKIDLDKFGFKF
ncbi:MAG TPA: MGMT family protein [Candidatus Nanoarchaeia archaeon]|nr:MGMT family protein [Candidatus Nanoarchaeia archaeon]